MDRNRCPGLGRWFETALALLLAGAALTVRDPSLRPPGGAWAAARIKRITAVRNFNTGGYSRLVFVLDQESIDFRVRRLERPSRIFIDIPATRLKSRLRIPPVTSHGGVIRGLRFGRSRKGQLRAVIRLRSPSVRHRVFTLPGPNRIVIDLRDTAPVDRLTKRRAARAGRGRRPSSRRFGRARGRAAAPAARRPERRQARAGRASSSLERPRYKSLEDRRRSLPLAERFREGLGRIVLDPGHGGKDPGTIGLYGLKEKNFVLNLARRTAALLRRRLPGNRVILTRRTDRYVSLAERTAVANDLDADVFVSIHANSSPRVRTRGIETYLLSEASSTRALEMAARESETSVARLSDLQKILQDLMHRSKVTESQQLADLIQSSIVSRLGRRYPRVRNLGVKRGPFYVLVGARMPGVLVETAFLTNPTEAKRSRTARYRRAIAEGIAEGIILFIELPPAEVVPALRTGRRPLSRSAR